MKYLLLSSVKLCSQDYICLKNVIIRGFKNWFLISGSLQARGLLMYTRNKLTISILSNQRENNKETKMLKWKMNHLLLSTWLCSVLSSKLSHPEFPAVCRHWAKSTWAQGLFSFEKKGPGRRGSLEYLGRKWMHGTKKLSLSYESSETLNIIPQDLQGGDRNGYEPWVALLGSHCRGTWSENVASFMKNR